MEQDWRLKFSRAVRVVLDASARSEARSADEILAVGVSPR